MAKNSSIKTRLVCYSITMMIALLWATVNLPFVYRAQLELSVKPPVPLSDEDATPFANSTEEKAPTSGFNEEYLHFSDREDGFNDEKLVHDHRHSYDIYVAFYGELISPPPDLS